jgi:hypothetical protein
MKVASIVSLGGELISADDADYKDYDKILTCPNCHEAVFLRKKHIRKGIEVAASFVHHKKNSNASLCELRVNSYSSEFIKERNSIARNQRLTRLKISLWKYLKTSSYVDFNKFSEASYYYRTNPLHKSMIIWVKETIKNNKKLIADEIFKEGVAHQLNILIDNNLMNDHVMVSYWNLHTKITKEVLEFLLSTSAEDALDKIIILFFCPGTKKLKEITEKIAFLNDDDKAPQLFRFAVT